MALFLSPKKLKDIPAAFRSHPLTIKFTVAQCDGVTPSAIPALDEETNSYVAEWTISHEIEVDFGPAEETEIAFEITSELTGGVVGFGEAMVSAGATGGTFHEIVKIIDNHCGFKGARLYVEIVQITRPVYSPKYMLLRIDHGIDFMEGVNRPAEQTTDIYIVISSGDREIGTTSKQRGPTLVWMDQFEEEYNGESSILLTGYGINKNGDTLDFGSARLNLWSILEKGETAKGECVKHGDVMLSPGGNYIERQSGKVSITLRFRDDYQKPLGELPPLTKGALEDVPTQIEDENSPVGATDPDTAPKALAATRPAPVLGAREPDNDSESRISTRADLEDRVKAAQKLADEAEDAARAADRAAADADIVARANPSREKDDLANGAEDAAKEARKNADDAASLARALIDECDRRKPRVEPLNKLHDQLQDKVNDALDNRDRAEDDAKAAIKLNADDLVAKAKEHFAKCADYAAQTAKLADANEDIPKLRALADGAHDDQAAAKLATQDAKADAKACADAKTLPDAYAAMRDCEAMVRDVADAEEEARIKWKKANKLIQRQKKAKELEQQQELQKMQEEAEAEAIKKREQRQRDHELDNAQRRSANAPGDENLAWNYAAAHMSNGSGQPPRTNKGGIFRNFCRDPPRPNPEVRIGNSDSGHGGIPVYDPKGLNCCNGGKTRYNMDDSTRAGDDSQLEFDGYYLRPKMYAGEARGRSFSGLEERQYMLSGRRPPWCWCFGCQCCHCCGEC